MRTSDLDFDLPPELIAQHPPAARGTSRLLHYDRQSRETVHRLFTDLPSLLREGDVLVLNDAKVTPARFVLRKPTGGRVEGLFLRETQPGRWVAMLRNLGPIKSEMSLVFEKDPAATVRVRGRSDDGFFELAVAPEQPAEQILTTAGSMPLPPYIKRPRGEAAEDRERYQTVYASTPGSVAAPTAGLHFTPELLDAVAARGVKLARLTLHVGLGTFKPVATEDLDAHPMHRERYELPAEACETINTAKQQGGRIIAVGTTATRVLESQPPGELSPASDETGLFIRPGYRWKHVDTLITNFHLPRSTLIALVAGFVGLEEQRRLYREAIEQKYRFFSYGDAMLLT